MTTKQLIKAAAIERFNNLPAQFRECDMGGCDKHSHHEVCSRMETMEECVEWAEEKFRPLSRATEGTVYA